MSMSFCVLGSGSAGNASLLVLPAETGDRFVLIDCGLSPRRTAAALAPHGLELRHLDDILLTHLDGDHCHAGWIPVVERCDIEVHVHRRHRAAAQRAGLPVRRTHLFDDVFELGDDTRVEPRLLAHDRLGTVGYLIEHAGARLGWATDLGRVPDSLFESFVNLQALAIESNYDRALQLASGRPPYLKRRIMGGAGHLSNRQALEAVLAIDEACDLAHVTLLHLSRQCNDPRLVTRLFAAEAGHLLDRLTVTSQFTPTPLLHVPPASRPTESRPPRRGQQLTMFDRTT